MVLALGVLTPFFQYIPKAALGAVILSSVIHMVDYKIVKKIWHTKKTDLLPFVVTFCLCLYDIATGIVCGILTALLLLIYRLVVPRIEARQQEVTVIRINGGLSYVGIEYLISKIEEVRLFVMCLLRIIGSTVGNGCTFESCEKNMSNFTLSNSNTGSIR